MEFESSAFRNITSFKLKIQTKAPQIHLHLALETFPSIRPLTLPTLWLKK